ncbi:hypothetical protein [Streptomyces sp. KR80]|uniref:hypothetical protein n=1 Tax=Streptomyces sp. KR80 TaxID=3457426 RepID=UPI003FD11315
MLGRGVSETPADGLGFVGVAGLAGFVGVAGLADFVGVAGLAGFVGVAGLADFVGVAGLAGFVGLVAGTEVPVCGSGGGGVRRLRPRVDAP